MKFRDEPWPPDNLREWAPGPPWPKPPELPLEEMTAVVRSEHPGWDIKTILFDHGFQVGVSTGLPDHRRFAKRFPIEGFTIDSLRDAVEKLGKLSKGAPIDG